MVVVVSTVVVIAGVVVVVVFSSSVDVVVVIVSFSSVDDVIEDSVELESVSDIDDRDGSSSLPFGGVGDTIIPTINNITDSRTVNPIPILSFSFLNCCSFGIGNVSIVANRKNIADAPPASIRSAKNAGGSHFSMYAKIKLSH